MQYFKIIINEAFMQFVDSPQIQGGIEKKSSPLQGNQNPVPPSCISQLKDFFHCLLGLLHRTSHPETRG